MRILLHSVCLTIATFAVGCTAEAPRADAATTEEDADPDREAVRILAVLNAETRDALGRDYDSWRDHWVHEPYVVKTYINLADGSGSETLGWDAVDDFVRTYIETHPEPEPPPSPLVDADIRVYGDGAWVGYSQDDADQGRKRESRRMEKVDGEWKIAGMHTTIYGPSETE